MSNLPMQLPAARTARRRGRGATTRGGRRWFTLIPLVAATLWVGCRAADYRRDADRVAYDIVRQKQRVALGHEQPFSIERPADTLRRRLMLDQVLPHADVASLSSADVVPIPQWPDAEYLSEREPDGFADEYATAAPLELSLTDALQIAAHESREYQQQKEAVFIAALALDLEADDFRATWTGVLEGLYEARLEQEVVIDDEGNTDRQKVAGVERGGVLGLTQKFRNGMTFTGQLGLDLASLLTQEQVFSRGIFADASISIPLLRGSGEFVVTEPLTQAERDVVYAIYEFERFRREFAVSIASEYLSVLQQRDQVENAEQNYRNLIRSTRRARRLADAGLLPEIQVDQSLQDELRARDRWVSAIESYGRRLDAFKLTLGLPVDAALKLDHAELDRLAKQMSDLIESEVYTETTTQPGAVEVDPNVPAPPADAPVELIPPGVGNPGQYELDPMYATRLALLNRVDLRVAIGRVYDAQRGVAVAADQLRADITLLGSGAAGARRTISSAGQPDAILRPDEGTYSALLTIDLPFERTAERNAYRGSLIEFERAVRNVQELEDQVKLAVRNRLSELLQARESMQIQARAVAVAQRRVASTRLFLEAGRAEIRDVLEAEEALLSAQNALTAAFVNYRVGELSLQRDLDVLEINERGLWDEFNPHAEGG